jgi:adenosylcobinamide kinase / adenosylcobinamide-phosphate guanylyltransferase
MGKITFITGGARSGKSSFAESLLRGKDDVLYIATALPFDGEMEERIKKHREERNRSWKTVEAYKNLGRIIRNEASGSSCILLDCLTIMVSNLMVINNINWERAGIDEARETEKMIETEVKMLIEGTVNFSGESLIVSNEIGMGVVPPTPLGRHFRDMAGRANQFVASKADEVYLLVSGIPLKIKGK